MEKAECVGVIGAVTLVPRSRAHAKENVIAAELSEPATSLEETHNSSR
jgi:hypothetical protein